MRPDHPSPMAPLLVSVLGVDSISRIDLDVNYTSVNRSLKKIPGQAGLDSSFLCQGCSTH